MDRHTKKLRGLDGDGDMIINFHTPFQTKGQKSTFNEFAINLTAFKLLQISMPTKK